MKSEELKVKIIEAGRKAVEQLIKVAKEDIIKPDPEDELAADRLKNAAATSPMSSCRVTATGLYVTPVCT